MTEITTIHVHMFDFLSVSVNLWLCSVRVQGYLFHCVKVSTVVIIIFLLLFFSLFCGVRVVRSLFSVQCFVDFRLSFCLFSFDYCSVCLFTTYRFSLCLLVSSDLSIKSTRFVCMAQVYFIAIQLETLGQYGPSFSLTKMSSTLNTLWSAAVHGCEAALPQSRNYFQSSREMSQDTISLL